MAPKRKTSKHVSGAVRHPPYRVLIAEAIFELKDRSGSSQQAIEKYIHSKYPELPPFTQRHWPIRHALRKGIEDEDFTTHSRHTRSYLLSPSIRYAMRLEKRREARAAGKGKGKGKKKAAAPAAKRAASKKKKSKKKVVAKKKKGKAVGKKKATKKMKKNQPQTKKKKKTAPTKPKRKGKGKGKGKAKARQVVTVAQAAMDPVALFGGAAAPLAAASASASATTATVPSGALAAEPQVDVHAVLSGNADLYRVLPEGVGGAFYDASLVLCDMENHIDKFVIGQVIHRVDKNWYFAFSRSGDTGTVGSTTLAGPYSSSNDAITIFEDSFRKFTGTAWMQRDKFVQQPGKYVLLKPNYAPPGDAKWQYYVATPVDGKVPGWYDYVVEASDILEQVYGEWTHNPDLSVRAVQSGHWKYKVDFEKMQQTNLEHYAHTVRQIRRAFK